MLFHETKLAGAYVIELERRVDDRGFFARTFCEREFLEHGLPTRFPQCNLSRNLRAATLRGMHYNEAKHQECKLVRCAAGAIFDVIIDLRPTSTTHLQWFGVELSAENCRALFVPEGFAHGFITLANAADVYYHMGDFYVPDAARGLRWDDPLIAVDWPILPQSIAERDATYPDFDPTSFDR